MENNYRITNEEIKAIPSDMRDRYIEEIINDLVKEKKEEINHKDSELKFEPSLAFTSKWIFLMLFAGGNTKRYNEPISGRIRLIKEIFLFLNQAKIKEHSYKFRPYKYGPFANEYLSDLNDLKHHGLITEKEGYGGQTIELTQEGLKYAKKHYDELDDELKRRLLGIKIRFNKMPLNELLSYVYSNYPSYAVNSEYDFEGEGY